MTDRPGTPITSMKSGRLKRPRGMVIKSQRMRLGRTDAVVDWKPCLFYSYCLEKLSDDS